MIVRTPNKNSPNLIVEKLFQTFKKNYSRNQLNLEGTKKYAMKTTKKTKTFSFKFLRGVNN